MKKITADIMSLHDETMGKLREAVPCAIPEPAAYRVVTNNTAISFYLTRGDAEHGASNRLTYVKGCTSAVIEPLYASPFAIAPCVDKTKYNKTQGPRS
jgi:hypothetical protein